MKFKVEILEWMNEQLSKTTFLIFQIHGSTTLANQEWRKLDSLMDGKAHSLGNLLLFNNQGTLFFKLT